MKYNLGSKYILKNLELLKKILREGSSEEKEFLWDEIRKVCPPEDINENKNECNVCLVNNQLARSVWEMSKREEWTADFTCWKCNTCWVLSFRKLNFKGKG